MRHTLNDSCPCPRHPALAHTLASARDALTKGSLPRLMRKCLGILEYPFIQSRRLGSESRGKHSRHPMFIASPMTRYAKHVTLLLPHLPCRACNHAFVVVILHTQASHLSRMAPISITILGIEILFPLTHAASEQRFFTAAFPRMYLMWCIF